MGVGSSLQNPKSHEPPPLPPPFGHVGRMSRFSRLSSASDQPSTSENEGKNRESSVNEEWWQNRPSAPSLQNLHQHPETLLSTYAAQMTGWQSDYSPSAPLLHQEAMELTRTVSHLAAANQQLATAHSALLSQLEMLYLELNKQREINNNKQDEKSDNLQQRIETIEKVIQEKSWTIGGKENNEDPKHAKKKEDDESFKKKYDYALERIKELENEIKINDIKWNKEQIHGDNVDKLRERIQELEADKIQLKEIGEKLKNDLEISTKDWKKLNEEDKKKQLNLDEECYSLRSRLSIEMENNKKQSEILDKSLRDNQRLNETLELMQKTINKRENVSDAETSMEEDLSERPNLEEFRKDLSVKREARQRAIAAVSSEMERLRKELDAEKEAHSETSKILDLLKVQAENVPRKSQTFSIGTITNSPEDWKIPLSVQQTTEVQQNAQRLTDILHVTDELRACIRLQIEKIDDLRFHLECEPEKNNQRIKILEEIGRQNKEAYGNRQIQINRLKDLQSQLVAGLSGNEQCVDITDDLRTEQERQVEDVRRLKGLYDKRMRILVDLKEATNKELSITKDKLKCIIKDKEGLDEEIKKAEEKIDVQDTEISNLESQLGLTKADCRDLQNQMSVINNLFSQMLLSASSADMDLDRLTELIQENHDLISDMAKEEGTEAAALPKLLLDLVEQVEGTPEKKEEDNSQEKNIANNLPKVWRVLLELLSCHAVESNSTASASLIDDPNICYKSVDTPSGPTLVISVSKTYIRLKELILEKKSLEKEMGRMKQLNSHLESKLGEQEKRLSTVADELSKTWNIVGRMQAQHQQLHTHEKILRYELQQKRKMLQELKQELEYCREKWESARQKNTTTEIEWRNLRREFAARKALAAQDSFNTSGESGFSDERGDDSDEEEMPAEERTRSGPRRRTRKESPRAPTPDTESEQPTDTELSETKTESSLTPPEQRTPTPEPADDESIHKQQVEQIESLNPLDQALANVIQNLIHIDSDSNLINESSDASSSVIEETKLETNEEKKDIELDDLEEKIAKDNQQESVEKVVKLTSEPCNSVFSIGPFPDSSNCSGKMVQFSDPLVVGPSIQVDEGKIDSPAEEKTDDSLVKLEEESRRKEKIKEEKKNDEVLAVAGSSSAKASRTPEEVLAARSERLKRLEEQAEWLMKKMNATNRRGSELSTRLEELHETYGDPPAPPPMPDVLPIVRIPTDRNHEHEEESKDD